MSTEAAIVLVAQATQYVTGDGNPVPLQEAFFEVDGVRWTAAFAPDPGGDTGATRTFRAIAIDAAGSQGQTATRTITGGATGAVATITSARNGDATNKTVLDVSGYAHFSGAGAGHQVSVSVQGGGSYPATLADGTAAVTSWPAAVTLPNATGSYLLTASASSSTFVGRYGALPTAPSRGLSTGTLKAATSQPASGAPSPDRLAAVTSDQVTIALDVTPPSLSVAAPAAGAYVTTTATFNCSASDTGSGLAEVAFSADGGTSWTPVSFDNTGPWSFTWTAPIKQDAFNYPILVRATDHAGNPQQVSRAVKVDNLPPLPLDPTVTVSSQPAPTGSYIDLGQTLNLSGLTPLDGSGQVTMQVALNQQPEQTSGSQVVNASSFGQSLNANGPWYAHLVLTDIASNRITQHFGPWYVDNRAAMCTVATTSPRQLAIQVDGQLNTGLGEWRSAELLDYDTRSAQGAQALYANWDANAFYLGWRGASAPTQVGVATAGALWAYLGTDEPGTVSPVEPLSSTLPFAASYALSIDSATAGTLWHYNGSA